MALKIGTINRRDQVIIESELLERAGNSYPEKTRALADRIHSNWQRAARESGLLERWKDIKQLQGEELSCYLRDYSAFTRKPERGVFHQVNILALSSRDLPEEHQTENLRSAAHTVGVCRAFLSSYDSALIRENLEKMENVFKMLPQEALMKDCKESGWISGFMVNDDQHFKKDEFNAIAIVASKIHDAWIERASSWLDQTSNQANHFFNLNNYNQRADVAILKSFFELES